MNSFELPAQVHQQLNPILWNKHQLKASVRSALLKIAQVYYNFLGIDTPIIDIVVSGSQANYNYGSKSDLDLHLIVNYSTVSCDMAIDELFDTKRKLWKEQHNIDIYGIPVEVYVEDSNSPAVSASYSIINNRWVKPPQKINASADVERIERICLAWIKVISSALSTQDLDQIDSVKELLWKYRQKGLDKEGEMGVPNLVFKTLRNSGVTDILLNAKAALKDRNLSLEDQII